MPSAPAAHDASGCERDVYHPCTNPPALTSDPGGTRLTPRRRARVLCNSAFCRRVRSATLLATLCPRIRPQRASDPLNRRNVSTFRCRNPLYCKGLRYRHGVWGPGGRRFESCRPDGENQRLTASLVGAVFRLVAGVAFGGLLKAGNPAVTSTMPHPPVVEGVRPGSRSSRGANLVRTAAG